MPMKGELYVQDHEGKQLEGPRDNKSSLIFEFNHEVYLPYDKDENKPTGPRKITAFTVTKEIDKLTPLLYQMVSKGRNSKKIEIRLYRNAPDDGSGELEHYFNYLFEDAKIISVENYMPFAKIKENEDLGHLEKIKFVAREIEWEFKKGNVKYREKTF